VRDTQNRVVPVATNLVDFELEGPGKILGVGNGDPSCHEPDRASERSAFNGNCMAIVQSKRAEAGTIAVTVTSAGLESATVPVSSETAPLLPVAE
jgi:beta-galactosidase